MGDRGDGSVAWRGAAVVAVLGAALGAAGCGPSDRWSVFEDSLELERRQHRMAPEVAERLAFDEDARATPDWVEGEGPIELSVEEATLMALEHNRDLQVQRLTPVIVATFEEIERGVFDPEVFARGDFLNEETVEVSRATEEEFPSRFTDTFGEVGLAQRLPTGTDVELSVSQGRSSSNRAPDQDVA
ncbi:MAG: TolC family protein, partial [Planctomycetota bacterium]|nr:TolC family protein [Planctomycetota bacterium]